jgi:hypothetical protein
VVAAVMAERQRSRFAADQGQAQRAEKYANSQN